MSDFQVETLPDNDLSNILESNGLEPETTTNEPVSTDNSEVANQSDNSTAEPQDSTLTEPIKVDNSVMVIDDNFINSVRDKLPVEFLSKFKGKTVADMAMSLHNIEKLVGKKEQELSLLKNSNTQRNQQPVENENIPQPIDWGNKQKAIDSLVALEMQKQFPEFESIESINEVHLTGDIVKAMNMMETYKQVVAEQQKSYEFVEDLHKNAGSYNWNDSVKTIDLIKEDLEDRDVSLEDLGITNDKLIGLLKSIKADVNPLETVEENLALLLLFDEKGNYDKRVFKQEYGVDRIDPERLMQKFKVSTNELVRQAKMQRKLGIEQKAKAEGFNAAIKNKPTQSLSSAGITGQVIKPKVTNLAMVSDAELQDIIEGN